MEHGERKCVCGIDNLTITVHPYIYVNLQSYFSQPSRGLMEICVFDFQLFAFKSGAYMKDIIE
jgi:hypothetical protein